MEAWTELEWTWQQIIWALIDSYLSKTTNQSWVWFISTNIIGNKKFCFIVTITFFQYIILVCHIPTNLSMTWGLYETYMSLPVHDHASNSNWLPSVHFCWGFTIKMNGSDTVKWFWIVQNRNSMLFTHWKHIEIPSISGQGDVSHYELFPVFINVLIKPSPFSITNVIEIRISIEPKIE